MVLACICEKIPLINSEEGQGEAQMPYSNAHFLVEADKVDKVE